MVPRQGDQRLYNQGPRFQSKSIPSLVLKWARAAGGSVICHKVLGAWVPAKAYAFAPQGNPCWDLPSSPCVQSLLVRGSPGAGLWKHHPAGKQETQIPADRSQDLTTGPLCACSAPTAEASREREGWGRVATICITLQDVSKWGCHAGATQHRGQSRNRNHRRGSLGSASGWSDELETVTLPL